MTELVKGEIYLQKAHRQNFLFYDQNEKEHIKPGYPYWKKMEGKYHMRFTPCFATDQEMNAWAKENLKQDLLSGILYVASGDSVGEMSCNN